MTEAHHPTEAFRLINERPLVMSVSPELLSSERGDVDYYLPHFIKNETLLAQCGVRLEALDQLRDRQRLITDGIRQHTKTATGVVLIRTQNLDDIGLSLDDCVYVDQKQHRAAAKSTVRAGDLLIAVRGYLGKVAIVPDDTSEANINQHIARVTVDPGKADSRYLWAFFASRIGVTHLERQVTGTVQEGIMLPFLRRLPVPLPPRPVQEYIGAKVRLAERCRLRAREHGEQADALLERTLGMRHFSIPQDQVIWVRPKELDSRWLNANFYMARYTGLLRHLDASGVKTVALSKLATCIRTKKRPDSGTIKYVEIGDIDTSSGMITSWSLYEAGKEPNNAQRQISVGDILVSTRRPNRGAVAVVDRNLAGSFASVFLARLRPKSGVSPWYIQLYLRSITGTQFLEQRCTETTYPVISEDDLETVPIPVIAHDIQQQIEQALVAREVNLRFANQLIGEAKADVEALIEGWLDVDGILSGRLQPPTWAAIASATGDGVAATLP